MKVKDICNTLDLMNGLIEKLKHNQDLSDLIGYYAFMTNNSGYYFSDNDPTDIIKHLEEMLGDISTIREDIESAIHDHGQDLEV